MSEIRVNKVINEAGSGAVELTEGASIPTGKNLTGAGGINITGDIVTTGTLTYEDVTNIDSVGLITARAGINVTGGVTTSRFGSVSETVSIASTTNIVTAKSVIMELDCSKGSVFTHNLVTGGNVGIVSIKNFKVDSNNFTTVAVIFTQGSVTPTAGAGNTIVVSPTGAVPAGIGTEVTLAPLGVAANAGIETSARVGSATTVVLSAVANDIDIVTFGIHYNGSGTGTAGNYTTIVTKSGDIRFGLQGF